MEKTKEVEVCITIGAIMIVMGIGLLIKNIYLLCFSGFSLVAFVLCIHH